MLVFHGGLTIEQVHLLQQNKYIIYKMPTKNKLHIPNKNTFDYYDRNITFTNRKEYWNYIRDDIYYNQYFFFFKYLYNTLSFCCNNDKKNYILVADIDDEILSNYIGCGRYINNQIEYRIPRKFIKLDNIKDFLFYEPWNEEQIKEMRKKYTEYFYSKDEDKEANKIINEKKLIFNEYKSHPFS